MAYKVLVVDDSKLARMAVAKALSTLHPDWERVEASNADEALQIARRDQIDVTLLDYNMPGRDGLSVAMELKTLRPNMPVAIISANHQIEIVTRAEEIGATFLEKPITVQILGAFFEKAEQRLRSAAQ